MGLLPDVNIFSKIAEQRIRESIDRGEFVNLAGAGKPLIFEDETWIPEDLRMAYRVLRNAGCIPPELELKKEIMNLQELIQTIDDDRERIIRKVRELNFKLLKLNEMRKRPLRIEEAYENKVMGKLAG